LLDEGVVDVDGDDFEGAETFSDVEETDDVGDELLDVGFIELSWAVVVGAEDVVVVFVDWEWETAVLDVEVADVAFGAAAVVEDLGECRV